MKYACVNCNYIYDESIGDREEGINSGTKFDHLGDYFECPVCGECADYFQEIIEEVNYIEKDSYLDLVSSEHYIDVDISGDDLDVKIGKGVHPSGEGHRITEIVLLDEYGDIVEEIFLEVGEEAEVNFDISGLDEFEIRVRCSLHGLWGRRMSR